MKHLSPLPLRRVFVLTVVSVLAGLVLAACGDDDPAPDVADPGARLGAWILTGGETDGTAIPIPAPERITLIFEAESLGGVAACNNYGASVAVDGAGVEVGEISRTAIGCRDDLNAIEDQFLSALSSVERFEVVDGSLALRGDGVDLRFERLPALDVAAVVDQRWMLEGGAPEPVSTPVLTLGGDGTIDGHTGCRELTGEWVVTGDEFLATRLSADGDHGACSAALQAQDGLVIEVIGDGFRAEVDGAGLTLTSRDGKTIRYVRAADAPTG